MGVSYSVVDWYDMLSSKDLLAPVGALILEVVELGPRIHGHNKGLLVAQFGIGTLARENYVSAS